MPFKVSTFWSTVARSALEELSRRPEGKSLWMSTAGQGVPWLHFRIENSPKYYSFEPYVIPESGPNIFC